MSVDNPAILERRVLILKDPQGGDALVRDAIRQSKTTAESCKDIEDFCRKALEGAAAAVLDNAILDRTAIDHLKSAFSNAPAWSDLPIIVLNFSKPGNEAATRADPCLGMENLVLLYEPVSSDTLSSLLRSAVRRRHRQYELRDLLLEQDTASGRLAALTEQMESFSHTVSHDLRAPLRAIRGFAQALSEDYGTALDTAGREYLHRMEQGAERMDRLIQDLLQYSRLARGAITLAPVDSETVLEQVLLQLEPEMRTSRAVINIQRPLPPVIAHGPSLQQVISALVANAIKFVAPGLKPQIRIWATTGGQRVRLWVGDNGIGIAPAHHERIFGVFERLHSGETYPGTGMGLAIVAKGMTRMGGSFGLESAPGEGSRFWVELPQA